MIIVPFYSIDSDAGKFAITIKDFCIGSSIGQTVEVEIIKGNSKAFSRSFNEASKSILIPGMTFNAGIYHLVIKVSSGGILIPHIKFITTNPKLLNIGKPVFQVSDAPVDQGIAPTTFDKEEGGNIAASSSTN